MSNWISIKDRMPTPHTPVVVWTVSKESPAMSSESYAPYKVIKDLSPETVTNIEKVFRAKITHWMKLSPPAK